MAKKQQHELEKYGYKIYDNNSSKETSTITDGAWWLYEDNELANNLWGVVARIESEQSSRRASNLRHARLYSNRDFLGFEPGKFSKTSSQPNNPNKLVLNITKSCVDTVAAKISKNKPRCMFLTSGADWEQQEAAKNATKYVDGLFEATNLYETAQQVFLDSCVQDIGALKIYVSDNDIKVERLIPESVLVADDDGHYLNPKQLHIRHNLPTESLLYTYPDHYDAIKTASKDGRTKIVESWHLRSGVEAKDGKHAICIEGKVLFIENYDKDYFPVVFLRWNPALVGFYGVSLAEELAPIQLQINRMLITIQKALEGAIPRALFDSASSINKAQFTDEVWSILQYTGKPPQFAPTAAMSGEVYSFLWQLVQKAYEISGVNSTSATGQKQAGITSGIAIRTLQDIESQRFVLCGQRWESFFVDVAKIMIDLTQDIVKANRKHTIKVKDGRTMRELNWLKDINLHNDQYLLRVYPISALPQEPSGRLEFVKELIDQKFIASKDTALSLLNYPDLDDFMSVETAGIDNVKRSISLILNSGIYEPPTKYLPLELAIQLAQGAVLRGQTEKRDEQRLDLLRQWIDECDQLLQAAQPPPPPQAPPLQ